MENHFIPKQHKGSAMDVASENNSGSSEEAILFYLIAKERLFDVNNWDKVCESSSTSFQLTDEKGNEVADLGEGRLIRIDIPGPGTSAGDGFDWVRVEKIAKQSEGEINEWAGFTVRPCANPKNTTGETAHFLSNAATSTFLVKRIEERVIAEVHGRNEKPNDESNSTVDRVRNTVVGITAKVGFSFPQWKLLVDGLVKSKE